MYIQSFRFSRVGDDAFDVEVIGKEELQSAAKLLGVSATMLIQGLTMRTHSVRGQAINSLTDSHQVKFSFSEKAKKIWKNLPLVLTLLSKNSCFVKTGGRFFQIL